jgi:hypothetical protein
MDFVERKITAIEGFAVVIRHRDSGRDVRGDLKNVATYPFVRGAAGATTVRSWIDNRFHRTYPEYDVDVLDGSGKKVGGGRRLSTVRDTYR